MAAKEWRDKNLDLDGNKRLCIYTTFSSFKLLGSFQRQHDNNIEQKIRIEKLNQTAIKELAILVNDRNIVGIGKLSTKKSIAQIEREEIKQLNE